MINNMKVYEIYKYSEKNEYGQKTLNKDEPVGTVKMSVYTTSQSVQDNINYKNANYVGFTYSKEISDTCVIKYGDEFLKVLYVNPGRVNQVYFSEL